MLHPHTDEELRPDPRRPVTAGLDGSEYADSAATWAAGEADRRGVPLRLLTVVEADVDSPLLGDGTAGPRWDKELEEALELLAETEARLRTAYPDLEIHRDAAAGDPVHALRAAARQAALLVVGSRGRGGFVGTTLGSVSLRLASASWCPLVVVPQGHGAAGHPGPAVIGIGARECIEALRYALEHAERGDEGLRVVHAWLPYPAHSSATYVSDTDIIARHAAEQAVEWLKDAHAEEFDVTPEIRVLRGRAGEVLVKQSRTADLLVLGSHRRRVPWSGGIGPVLHHVLMHSHCPVAVVPVR